MTFSYTILRQHNIAQNFPLLRIHTLIARMNLKFLKYILIYFQIKSALGKKKFKKYFNIATLYSVEYFFTYTVCLHFPELLLTF